MNARNAFASIQLHSELRLFMIKSNIYDETTCIDYSLMRLSCARSIMVTTYFLENSNPTIIPKILQYSQLMMLNRMFRHIKLLSISNISFHRIWRGEKFLELIFTIDLQASSILCLHVDTSRLTTDSNSFNCERKATIESVPCTHWSGIKSLSIRRTTSKILSSSLRSLFEWERLLLCTFYLDAFIFI